MGDLHDLPLRPQPLRQTGPMRIGSRSGALVVLAVITALAGCSSGSTPAASPSSASASSDGPGSGGSSSTASTLPAAGSAPAAATADWPTYHANAARTGAVAGLPAAGPLSLAWTARLGGAVYGQPLIIGGTVVAATESNQVYGLSRATGQVVWSVRIGTGHPVPLHDQPCGNIDPLGITGTPVYDPATGLVYAVAETTGGQKVLAGIRVSDGKLTLSRNIPAPDHEPAYDQQRAALALATGRIYVAFGGHFGDCGPYRGSVVAIPAAGNGPILSYVVPAEKQAGIWAPGGPVVGPGSTIYVAAGNGVARQPPFDGSDSVIALSPKLQQIGVFAPKRWPEDNTDDLDLGSMSPALLPDGRMLQVGKSGIGYLLNAKALGGVGGQLAEGGVCNAFGGPAVSRTVIYVPCFGTGLTAVDVGAGQVRVLWRGPASANGSPVIGGGAVWVGDWTSGTLYELGEADGKVHQQIRLGSALPHFASPSLSGGLVLIGTLHGVAAVSGA
jgi:outer membrane protein assembly factor BamB